MKFYQKIPLSIEAVNKKYTPFFYNFYTFVIILKLIAVILLIHGEYTYLTERMCQNQTHEIALLYPYAAFVGVLILGTTQFCMVSSDIKISLLIEFISNILLSTVLSAVSLHTLRYCLRPKGIFYYLPEIYGLIIPVVLLINLIFWYCKHKSEEVQV